MRNLRFKKYALDGDKRTIDKIQCYSKLLTCLTLEGIAQIQNLDNRAEINEGKDPLVLCKHILLQ